MPHLIEPRVSCLANLLTEQVSKTTMEAKRELEELEGKIQKQLRTTRETAHYVKKNKVQSQDPVQSIGLSFLKLFG